MPRPGNAPRLGGDVEFRSMSDLTSHQPSDSEQNSGAMAEVFEDAIDLHIDLVETIPMDGANKESLCAYPLPLLKKRGEQETRRFRTVLLENDYLRATFVPALGGRLLSLFDKRVGRELLFSGSDFALQKGSQRGVWAEQGITLDLGDEPRSNALGNVDYRPQPGMEEGDPAAAWFGETFACGEGGSRASLQWCAAVGPGVAALEFEVRVGNRERTSCPVVPTLSLPGGSSSFVAQAEEGAEAVYVASETGGVAVVFEEGTLQAGQLALGARAGFRRLYGGEGLASRQQDRFRVVLIPAAFAHKEIAGGAIAVAEAGIAVLNGKELRFHATQPLLGAKLEILSDQGTFAAPMDFHPEKPASIPLDSIPGSLEKVAIVSSGNHVLLTVQPMPATPVVPMPPIPLAPESRKESGARTRAEIQQELAQFESRIAAGIELAVFETVQTRFAKADALLDQVLTWNGDDPLAWWQKAVVRRLGPLQEEGEEDAARMNAHFLSPLEPALRAEAFLSMEQTHGKDPHPLVEPLTDNPENLVEVACLYIVHGFYVDAGRWIDEALRHKDLAILHYLQAYLFLTQSQMKAQAAEHLSRAAKAQETPLPWRPTERKAIQALKEAFPTDVRLQRLQAVLDQAFPST